MQRPNILSHLPESESKSFSISLCRVISCPCFSAASRTRSSLPRSHFAPFFLIVPCQTAPNAVTIAAFMPSGKKERKKSVGSSGRMYNAKWITCWLLHSSTRFFLLFSRALCANTVRIHPGGDLFGFPRPELRWCLSGNWFGLQIS